MKEEAEEDEWVPEVLAALAVSDRQREEEYGENRPELWKTVGLRDLLLDRSAQTTKALNTAIEFAINL
jgi:hypothetical protein